MKKGIILFFCMIFALYEASAQQKFFKLNSSKDLPISGPYLTLWNHPKKASIAQVPANFYVNNLGFFCRQELMLEAATRIPIRFRLGSMQYCNWMEGKPNASFAPSATF